MRVATWTREEGVGNPDSAGRRLRVQSAASPVLLAVAYFVGAQIGFALQAPNAPQSVLWLPNSIILAALIVLPVRRWPRYLAAALPAQMLVAWSSNAPFTTMALLFVTNCTDAALGAWLVRGLSKHQDGFQFDGLRSTLIFACGATAATVLLSFADAGLSVATAWAADYRAAFTTRVRSNVLTHFIVVPALIDLYRVDWRRVRTVRVIEASALTVLLTATCALAFGYSGAPYPALLFTPLPFLLWAAVRFGPGATGWTALMVSFVASWNALHDRGPFSSRSPLDALVSLQLFLLASDVPLLFLAAVIRERNRAMAAVRRREAALRKSFARSRELAGKLIKAQEVERARIARDLHDDVTQQLAALSLSISAVRRRQFRDEDELHGLLKTLQEQTVALTDQIRLFSRELHPRTLEHVGLASALRTHCTEFARQYELQLSLDVESDLGEMPHDVAICAYRIVQEGLRNIAAHSGVGEANVSIARSHASLDIAIADRGRGFEPETVGNGLGLMSIGERARLVGGTVAITSSPGRGTRLDVRIPVPPASQVDTLLGRA